jgi:TRAP-type C4-dicarboxylate transport system substrate-binding protein
MKKCIINAALFFLFLLLGFDCIVSHAQEKIIRLNYQTFQPATHWYVPFNKDWINEIEKGTGGTVKITQYPMGLLSPQAQTYDGVVKGIIDIGETVPAYSAGRFPFMEIADIPLGGKSATALAHAMNELYKKYKPKEFDDVKVLYFHTSCPLRLQVAKKPVYKLEDLKGLKVRTSGGSVRILKLLGATPVAMPMSDTYDAISRGVVDANWNSDEALRSFKLADIIKYSVWCDANVQLFVVAMNKGKWNSMSPKQQKVIEEATSKLMEKHIRGWDTSVVQSIEWAKKEKGVQFILLSEEEQKRWTEKTSPLVDEYVQKMKKMGVPGDEAVKFATDYLKTHQ